MSTMIPIKPVESEFLAHDKGGRRYMVPTETKEKPYVRQFAKRGRNEPCRCRSGKKYKRCCGVT